MAENNYITKKRFQLSFLLLIILIIPTLSLTRLVTPSEIDDIHPIINCPEVEQYNPKVLWVIPKYNNISIAQNKTWCNEILALNKTLGLHGYMHNYQELNGNISIQQIEEAIKIFESCFGFKPTMFKPPQLTISRANEKILEDEYNLSVKKEFHQVTRKVYHCSNTGRFSNKWIKWF